VDDYKDFPGSKETQRVRMLLARLASCCVAADSAACCKQLLCLCIAPNQRMPQCQSYDCLDYPHVAYKSLHRWTPAAWHLLSQSIVKLPLRGITF
jgi:hypothetical protein